MKFYGTYAKRWWASLSIWFGGFLVVAGTLVQYLDTVSPTIGAYFGQWGGVVTVGIGVANVLLRLRTSRPIRKPGQ